MYVCMYLGMYECIYVHMNVDMYVCVYLRVHVCMYVCMFSKVPSTTESSEAINSGGRPAVRADRLYGN